MPLSDLLHLLAPLVTSCRDFQEAWNSAPVVPSGDPLTGRWHGDWHSDANGFQGPLRAVLVRLDEHRWRATFHATFAKVLKACYSTDLVVDVGSLTFTGSSDLGTFGGGVYDYAGEVAGDLFTSTFRSHTDHGTFRMRRV